MTVLEIKNLVKFYGSFKAVDEISFTVHQGDVFGFLGPNGAGKSTTIRMMLSLIKPDHGDISVFGKSLFKYREETLSRIGCIVEKPDFYGYLSAEKNIEIFSKLSGNHVTGKKIYELLEFVGLKGREKDKVKGFSHGMKQRLGIAQTLIHDPDLIILDEPTTGLDPQGIIDVRNLILQLKSEKKKTVILSSHILSEIELIANRMLIINKGKVIVEGDVKELLNQDQLIVQIELNDPIRAKAVADEFIKNGIEIYDSKLIVQIDRETIPILVEKLTTHGVRVYAVEVKRKLEDYFLKLIGE